MIQDLTGVTVTDVPGQPSPLEKFQNLRKSMHGSLIERNNEVNMLLLALISGEHCVFVGPAGTAKSKMITNLVRGIGGGSIFHALLTKFSDPSEIFGPLNVAGLKEGRYERLTNCMLPQADVAFLDEIFKGSSAICNSLLTAIEERKYVNNGKWHSMPLQMLVGASNEWPVGEGYGELTAFFDRFLFRCAVKPISPASRDRLIWGELPEVHTHLTLADIKDAQVQSESLGAPKDTRAAFEAIVSELNVQGIRPGDRRLRKAAGAARAQAWLNGHDKVMPADLECLKDVLWEDPREQPAVASDIVCKIANPSGAEVTAILGQAEELLNLPSTVKGELNAEFISTIKKLREIREKLEKMRLGVADTTKLDETLAYLRERLRPLTSKTIGDL